MSTIVVITLEFDSKNVEKEDVVDYLEDSIFNDTLDYDKFNHGDVVKLIPSRKQEAIF